MPKGELDKKGKGRPLKLTPDAIRAYCDLIEKHVPHRHAAAAIGVTQPTVSEWFARGHTGEEPFAMFLHCVQASEAKAVGKLTKMIADAAADDPKHWKAAAHLLSAVHGVSPVARSERLTVSAEYPAEVGIESRDRVVIENGSEVESPEVRVLKASVLRITMDLERARKDGSHTAISRLGSQLDAVQLQLIEARVAANKGNDVRNLPEADVRDRLRIAAEQMPEPHLAVFAAEWLRRHRLVAVPTDGGIDEKGRLDEA